MTRRTFRLRRRSFFSLVAVTALIPAASPAAATHATDGVTAVRVVKVAKDENAQRRPRTVRLAGVVRLADIGDERIGIEAGELVFVQATVRQVRRRSLGRSRLGTGDLTRRVEQREHRDPPVPLWMPWA